LANGDPNKGEPGTAVISTRQTAAKYLFDGETVDSDPPVIAIEVKGDFNANAFGHPRRAQLRSPSCGTQPALNAIAPRSSTIAVGDSRFR